MIVMITFILHNLLENCIEDQRDYLISESNLIKIK